MKSLLIHYSVYMTVMCAALCCPEEDNFNLVNINASFTDGIVIENTNTLRVNDTLWVNLRLPTKVRNEKNEEIDIFDLTEASSFEQSFNFFQETGFENDTKLVFSQSDIVANTNQISLQDNGQIIFLRSDFSNDAYEGRFGIKLKQVGDFYLTAQDPDGVTRLVISNNPEGDTAYTIWVTSNVKDVDNMNRFNFTVTE